MGLVNKYYDGKDLKDKVPEKIAKFLTKLGMLGNNENIKAVLGRTSMGAVWETVVVTDKQVIFFTQDTKVKTRKLNYPLHSLTGVSVASEGKIATMDYIFLNVGGGNSQKLPIMAAPVELNKMFNCIQDMIQIKTQNNNQNISAADEILKYKQLQEQGIITEQEFNEKKKQLLGL